MDVSDSFDWLPELYLLSSFGGDWDSYQEAVYRQFCKDFITSNPSYPGKRWAVKRNPQVKGKEATFWHLISKGESESERFPDMRRCERIAWPRAMISAIQSGKVKIWPNRRGKERRIAIALPDFSYVVILADRGDYILLWTAYVVETNHHRRKLEKEYEDARKNGLAAL